MADAVLATLCHPACDNRRQRSGSGPRKRRNRGDVEHIHLAISLLLAHSASRDVAARVGPPGPNLWVLLLATGPALCSNTDRHASLRLDSFRLRQCSTLVGSGM